MTLRNITQDLQERLKAITVEREQLTQKLEALRAREERVSALLADELERWGALTGHNGTVTGDSDGGTVLQRFVRRVLASGKPMFLLDLTNQAIKEGIVSEDGSPGRKLHIVLVNLQRAGVVTRLPSKAWQIVKQKEVV